MKMEIKHQGYYLAHANGASVQMDEPVKCFRGEDYIITGGRSPHKPSSTGKVWVKDTKGNSAEYYPTVFDMKWEKR
jgi:hypothetical protein